MILILPSTLFTSPPPMRGQGFRTLQCRWKINNRVYYIVIQVVDHIRVISFSTDSAYLFFLSSDGTICSRGARLVSFALPARNRNQSEVFDPSLPEMIKLSPPLISAFPVSFLSRQTWVLIRPPPLSLDNDEEGTLRREPGDYPMNQ